MFTYSLFASQLVAIGAWEHHCSLPASFRSLSAGCPWLGVFLSITSFRKVVKVKIGTPCCRCLLSTISTQYRS
ncbi:hypothetical protein V8C86DRAFT_2495117, partial [Haematococcus lacustris]